MQSIDDIFRGAREVSDDERKRRRRLILLAMYSEGPHAAVANDPSTQLSSTTIPENTATSTAVFTASVSGVYTGTPSYTLGGTDDASFSINASTGVVTLDLALDYDTDPTLSIDITVADIVPLPAVNPRTFTITVTDVEEGGGTAGEPMGLLLTLTKAA